MKFTLSWLKDHLDTEADVETISTALTNLGLEVESVTDRAKILEPFTVAHVIEAKPHPDADRLQVCMVETKFGTMQVVCGAPNARTGLMGVFAPSGTTIPGTGMVLKPTRIRGVESNGMLCSEREMGLSDEHTGIIELPEGAKVGEPFADVAGLDDPVFDIAITPNRAEALGVSGIARDLAAAGIGAFKPPRIDPIEGRFESDTKVRLDLTDAETACPLFVGRLIKGVKNGPSPDWLQQRLAAIGLRPISALVDITNYISYEFARPLHVYDADKLDGDIIVRLAKDGEELLALDGKTYTLDSEMCVIADEKKALGLGGVMGGEGTGCTKETVNVYVESALFDPIRTARTGRMLGIDSDARYRFERGVDPEGTIPGMERATRMIMEFCGGSPSKPVIAGEVPDNRREVPLRHDRVWTLGGVDLPQVEQIRILQSLGFAVQHDGADLSVTTPSWRHDVDGEADLVEDILRINGYDKIPATPLEMNRDAIRPALSPAERRHRLARRMLAARGLAETVTWSFVSSADAALFGGATPDLALENPISADLDAMRPSILPNLIRAAGRNSDRGFANVGLYELGPCFSDDTPEGQAMIAAGIRRGDTGERHWDKKPRPVGVFDAKADVVETLRGLGLPVDRLQAAAEAPGWYHPGRSGVLKLGPKNLLAAFGEIHPAVLEALDVKGPVVGFEIMLDALPLPKARASRTRPRLEASDFQAVERDFAFVVDRDTPAQTLIAAAQGVDRQLVTSVNVFDVYEGKGVDDGKKSIALSIRLEPTKATLTDAEIDAVADKLVIAVTKATGGTLRG
ncbi:MAG TPA: phenylalanine--tRNA ligase subunit beta [Alphaproteobacteria bacterium]|nr:phenylalanine--tRNA ligase subunit beta [Alphaproteobacteria bacterium]